VFLCNFFKARFIDLKRENGYTIGALLESAAYHEAFEPQIMVWHSIFAIEHCFKCGSLSRM
jgi:hypothetical protein